MVLLQKLFSAERPVDRLPFISLGDLPIAVAVPLPVQLGYALLHALNKPVNRTHAMFGVFWAALERKQGDDTVIYDHPDLLGRSEGGVGARQHCLCESCKRVFVGKRSQETYIGTERWTRREKAVRRGKTSSWGCGHRAEVPSW